MRNDPQLDVDEAPKGAQYKIDDLVFTCDNDIMVVVDVQFVGSLYNGMDFDENNPVNYDYLLMTKECEEHWYSHSQIEHKANHMRKAYNG